MRTFVSTAGDDIRIEPVVINDAKDISPCRTEALTEFASAAATETGSALGLWFQLCRQLATIPYILFDLFSPVLWHTSFIFVVLLGTISTRVFADDGMTEAVKNRIASDLKKLIAGQNQQSYSTLPHEKAEAVCIDWSGFHYLFGELRDAPSAFASKPVETPVRVWQYAARHPTVGEARQTALNMCQPREQNNGCICEIFDENDVIAFTPPTSVISRLAEEKEQYEARGRK